MAFGIGSLAMSDFMQVPSCCCPSYPRKAGGPSVWPPATLLRQRPETATHTRCPVPLVPIGLITAGMLLLVES